MAGLCNGRRLLVSYGVLGRRCVTPLEAYLTENWPLCTCRQTRFLRVRLSERASEIWSQASEKRVFESLPCLGTGRVFTWTRSFTKQYFAATISDTHSTNLRNSQLVSATGRCTRELENIQSNATAKTVSGYNC